MSHERRDARRWSAYERLATDPSAAPSERAQAREQIEALRQRYPDGRPGDPEPEAPRRRRTTWEDEPSPAEREARAAAARARRSAAVARQRAEVERVPDWEKVAILADLHSASDAWSEEEQRAFKDARVRLTGSSRAVDL